MAHLRGSNSPTKIPRGPRRIGSRGWCIKFATGLNTKIDIVQKVYKWSSCPFAKMILPKRGSFWQKDSLITHILFELCLIMIVCPVANLMHHPLASPIPEVWINGQCEEGGRGAGVSECGGGGGGGGDRFAGVDFILAYLPQIQSGYLIICCCILMMIIQWTYKLSHNLLAFNFVVISIGSKPYYIPSLLSPV